MLMLLVKIVAALLITVPAILLSKRLEKKPETPLPKRSKKSSQQTRSRKRLNKITPYIALSIIPVASVLSTSGIDMINDVRLTPRVEVKADSKTKSTEVLVNATSSKYLESLAIDISILGKIKNVQDMNSITDGHTTIKQHFVRNTTTSQNNIEFYIEDMEPKKQLEYKIFYEPAPAGMRVLGTDIYKISYSWPHGGRQLTDEKWISLKTGQEVKEPPRVWGAFFQDKEITQEDNTKLYQEGTKRRNLGK